MSGDTSMIGRSGRDLFLPSLIIELSMKETIPIEDHDTYEEWILNLIL